jgi:hypothetical protein
LLDNTELLVQHGLPTAQSLEKEIRAFYYEAEEDYIEYIYDYLEEVPEVFTQWKQMIMEYNGALLGSSEYHYLRVYSNHTITYSPQDIMVEIIK